MARAHEHRRHLSRMEEERRQTQRQLDRIERQITRRMTALIPTLLPKKTHYRRGQAPDPGAFLERYRSQLAALTAEHQAEIDALAGKLSCQDQAIGALHEKGNPATIVHGRSAQVPDDAPICHTGESRGYGNG